MVNSKDSDGAFKKLKHFFSDRRFQDSSWSWVVCFSAAVCNGINLGFALSFGVLFPELMKHFNASRERIAWVGSIGLAMVWFASLPAGYMCDHFGYRITWFLGGMLCMTGLAATSVTNSLTLMYFTYGLVYGLGACFIYISNYLAVRKYFNKKFSLAVGITALGSSVGVLYNGPLLQVLLDVFGWRNTFRILMAAFALVSILSLNVNPNVIETTIATGAESEALNMKQQVGIRGRISFYCSVWKFPVYTFVAISLMVGCFGMYIPYINLVNYCEDVGITAQSASRLFIFIGLTSSLARILTGQLCNNPKINSVFVYQSSLFVAGVSVLLLPLATKYWALVVFSCAYGISDGIFITTQNYILLSCVDKERATASFCILSLLYSFSAATGGPIAGLIADKYGNYINSFYMTGGVLMLAFVIPFALTFINWRKSQVSPEVSREMSDVEAEK
ncbi:monocarboxylate transporter 10-like [Stylophora pistillata]|uniref:Monocarboxylate transporter 8 n=1 Tax=Stylophora pistillata TaxID=50429 RepID=A0A2B4RY15_STYPI|nr:monocarboxylate transporter 10-like [Stylophora pistillata]PFX23334.1 Monocarboxylate transporter 8 [Stylophora pistillata]